ncbi:MAG: carboxypeptidase-like regulatory domain-containing protein, partial [Bacteroidota bacterium]|nr:carboxypeptidase-like regulatory domain-containing protein [Bacteroidota bacterium]
YSKETIKMTTRTFKILLFRFILILLLFIPYLLFGQTSKQAIFGKVTDLKSGEELIGVSVSNTTKTKGLVTNHEGNFSIELDVPVKVLVSYIGYETQVFTVDKNTHFPILIQLKERENQLTEVIVKTSKAAISHTTYAGSMRINPKELRFIPTAAGEQDPMQALSLLPGIKKGSGGGEGFFVRGGSPDQNLILLDEAPVYNPNHLLGFFSLFQPEAIQDMVVYKGGVPAQYGGRLSSVMRLQMKEGNFTHWETEAGLGLLSSRVFLNGPIFKNKVSLSFGMRRSYLDQLFKVVGNNLPYHFTDLNLKLALKVGKHGKLSYTQYYGNDILKLNNAPNETKEIVDFGTKLLNKVSSLQYQHLFPSTQLNIVLSRSNFQYWVDARFGNGLFGLESKIADWQFKADINQSISTRMSLRSGIEFTNHHFEPNRTRILGEFNTVLKTIPSTKFNSNEGAVFTQFDHQVDGKLSYSAGLRLSSALGKDFVYANPEARWQLNYNFNTRNTIKLFYGRMFQYMHLVSGSSGVMPTDIWFPVSSQIKPQSAHQFSFSFEHKPRTGPLSYVVEPYFKLLDNLTEYREGAQILLNSEIEKELLQGKGRAYGLELLIKKDEGRLKGWVGYTLSYTERKFVGLNQGNWFYARYDRRHDISLTSCYEINSSFTFSGSFTLSSGMRVTPIVGRYAIPSGSYNEIISIPIYGDRNSLVLSPLHRVDLNLTYKHTFKKRIRTEWSVGAFNVYNRTQAFKLRMQTESNGDLQFKQVGLYGFIPSFSCNIQF